MDVSDMVYRPCKDGVPQWRMLHKFSTVGMEGVGKNTSPRIDLVQFVCRPPCVIVFRHITAPMLANEEDKISVLALMDLMAPDCDISVLDGLKYVSRFGIPLKKYWKT
ncbi:hypothetical protein ACFX19_029526 [Malus domestica]